jgi:hypothetical protein
MPTRLACGAAAPPEAKCRGKFTFANYSVISANTNLDVLSEEPATYFDRIIVPKEELTKQFIPLNRDLWHVSRYKEFLAQRRHFLAEEANKFIGL